MKDSLIWKMTLYERRPFVKMSLYRQAGWQAAGQAGQADQVGSYADGQLNGQAGLQACWHTGYQLSGRWVGWWSGRQVGQQAAGQGGGQASGWETGGQACRDLHSQLSEAGKNKTENWRQCPIQLFCCGCQYPGCYYC